MSLYLDKDVINEAKARKDFNVSGAVNEFLKQRLAGNEKSVAQLKIEVQRNREQAQSLREEAKELEQIADRKEEQIEKIKEQRQSKQEQLYNQVDFARIRGQLLPKNDDEQLAALADQAGLEIDEFIEQAKDYYDGDADE